MGKPIRVLQRVGSLGHAGLEAVVMNYYRHVDKTKVQFDFVVESKNKQKYDDEILALGGRIHRIRYSRVRRPLSHLREFYKILKTGEYEIVHLHNNSASIALEALVAKLCKVPHIIGHSHNTSCKLKLQHYALKPFLRFLLTDFFACSTEAAQWLYGRTLAKKATVLKNAIDANRFSYNPQIRKAVREELKITDKVVLGHVGRFDLQKNHTYLLDVFHEFQKKEPRAVLVLVGSGSLREQIEEKAQRLGIFEHTLFLGNRNDVAELYQAFDLFFMPSLFEGLGIVAVEAQATGLPCLISKTVPKECVVTDLVTFLNISAPALQWAEAAEEILLSGKTRCNQKASLAKSGYDITIQGAKLQAYYESLAFCK